MSNWTWIAAGLEYLIALALLLGASIVFWRRRPSKLFLIASAGFLVGLVGNIYRMYVLTYADVICEAGAEKIAQFMECANRHAAIGSAIAGIGLIASGVALLIYALKWQPEHERRAI